MKLYLVVKGERCEGSSPRGIYSSKEKATDAIDSIIKDCRGKWTKQSDSLWYDNGCDFLEIVEIELDK